MHGGDSAGGTLAAAAALRAVVEGPRLSALLLVYPLVSAAIETGSRTDFGEGYVISSDDLVWFGEQYVARAHDLSDPRLALDTADLAGLPPTLVITNECVLIRQFDRAPAEVPALRLVTRTAPVGLPPAAAGV